MFTKKRKVSGDVIQQAEQVEVHVENAEEPSLPASSFEIPTGPPYDPTGTSCEKCNSMASSWELNQ